MSVVVVVMFSIVLHELGHARAALWQGDTTARDAGHMTLDPMVHMGPLALGMLVLMGISWGLCPVNPRKFRDGRRGEAFVAAAGPAVNFALMMVFAVLAAAWAAYNHLLFDPSDVTARIYDLFRVGAVMNAALCILNLIPAPPLDGFTVASSLSKWWRDNTGVLQQQPMIALFVIFVFGARPIFSAARWISTALITGALSLFGGSESLWIRGL